MWVRGRGQEKADALTGRLPFFGVVDKLGVIIQGRLKYNSPAFLYHVPRCKFSLRQTNRFPGMSHLERVF